MQQQGQNFNKTLLNIFHNYIPKKFIFMWQQKYTLDKWQNEIFDSQKKLSVSEAKKIG